jgi:hypothetical protein
VVERDILRAGMRYALVIRISVLHWTKVNVSKVTCDSLLKPYQEVQGMDLHAYVDNSMLMGIEEKGIAKKGAIVVLLLSTTGTPEQNQPHVITFHIICRSTGSPVYGNLWEFGLAQYFPPNHSRIPA